MLRASGAGAARTDCAPASVTLAVALRLVSSAGEALPASVREAWEAVVTDQDALYQAVKENPVIVEALRKVAQARVDGDLALDLVPAQRAHGVLAVRLEREAGVASSGAGAVHVGTASRAELLVDDLLDVCLRLFD